MFNPGLKTRKICLKIIEDTRFSVLYTFLFASLPYTSLMSAILVAFVTLRKGPKAGALIFLSALLGCTSSGILMGVSSYIVILDACLTYVPCFLAAVALRMTVNWRVVGMILFLQLLTTFALLHAFSPDFVMVQFQRVLAVLKEIEIEHPLLVVLAHQKESVQYVYANLFVGFQGFSLVFFAVMVLMIARSLQSRLFYPGGFRDEMLKFRADKATFVILVAMIFLAKNHYLIALNLLPVVCFYFIMAGLSLGFDILNSPKTIGTIILLLGSLIIAPYVMLPLYFVLGAADSVINFRIYLSNYRQKRVRG